MLVLAIMVVLVVTANIQRTLAWSAWFRTLRVLASAATAAPAFAYLRRMARRADAPRLARAASALAWIAPAALLLQLLPPLQSFRMESPSGSAHYGATPMHVIGHTQALPLFVRALLTRADLGLDHVPWLFMTAAGLASVALFFCAGRVFARVPGCGTTATGDPSSPSPGTPGEGRGGGLLLGFERKGPHPRPPPEYRERDEIPCP
jgi:hypothetical protein